MEFTLKLRYKIYLGLSILAGVFLWGRCSKPIQLRVPVPANVLPKDDKEQIVVDPVSHKITIMKPEGNSIFTLPDRPSIIDIHKDGSVAISSKQMGFEHRFFIGLNGSDAIRFGAGVDLGYWKKLDVGVGVMDQFGNYTPRVFALISYNVYSNCRIGLTFDNTQHIGGMFTVRL